MKKVILPAAIMLALVATAGLSSCDFGYRYTTSSGGSGGVIIGGDSSVSLTGDTINFMVYQPSNQDDQRALQTLISEFVSETGISVRLNAVPKDSYDATFRASFRGMFKPDLAYMDQPLIATYASDGSIIAIDNYIEEAGIDTAIFNEAALATITLA